MHPQNTQGQAPPDVVERAARAIHLERTGLEMDSRCYDGDPVGHSCWTLARVALAAAAPTMEQVAEVLAAHADESYAGDLCACGWRRPRLPGAVTPGSGAHRRHQAEQVVALWSETAR